eukprot:GFUD01001885.1.p1 GENE.GFUD01001885.1~~GFUD01001885.1.p1  ORF type:complete len:393 (-),score=182.01 GFUD01001885.1:175-1353(-)
MAVGGALFGPTAARNASKSLVEFRAGKMNLNISTKMVSPDKRKGMLSVLQSDDQLMHLQWKDRTTGTVEDDLIIFPDDVEFKAVPACTTGRAFVLKFKTSNKRMFFWMQEPKADKDEELCKKVNDNLNNPPAPGSARSGAGLASGLPAGLDFNNLGDSELQNLLNNMSQQQLMQLFGGSLGGGNMSGLASLLGGAGAGRSRQAAGTGRTRPAPPADGGSSSPATPATPTTVPVPAPAPGGAGQSTNPIQLSDLQSILSNIQVPPGGEAVGEGSAGPAVDLSTALTGEALQPILQNQQFLDKVKEFLPAGEDGKEVTTADLAGTVQSPQFQQAVSMFSIALSSGQLGPLVREFGLGEDAATAAAKGDMGAFVKALQKEKEGDGKDKQEDMALD